MAEMKSETDQKMKFEYLHKVGSEAQGLIAQSIRASERNPVVLGSNPNLANFTSIF